MHVTLSEAVVLNWGKRLARLTEAEAKRRLSKMPGFKMDEDGFGHQIMTPNGLLWTRGARVGDEVFESETFGTINISEIRRNTESVTDLAQPIGVEAAMQNVSRIEINRAYAARLGKERLREPIFVVFSADGWHVIDGAHRITRLHQLRKKTVYARLFRPEILKYARVKRWIQSADGAWTPCDTVSDEQVEREIAAGLSFLARMERDGIPMTKE